jgi:hypothetical protein
MEATHSPGPWSVAEWDTRDRDGAIEAGGYQVVDAAGYLVSACTTEGATDAEEANVRLIAAAPDMLEALEACYAALHPNSDEGALARYAIAKATGEAV